MHQELMKKFKRAFATADADGLAQVVTSDFAWHMHWFPGDAPAATGHVVRGVEAVMAEIDWRREHWSEVRFDGVDERYIDDVIVQTFTISGLDHDGRRFEVDAVDLYRVEDDRLALKDTYWKQQAKDGEAR